MRLASVVPRACLAPVPVASAPDGTWIELAALTGRRVPRLDDALPWLQGHYGHLCERAAGWTGPRYRNSEFEFLPPIVRPAAFRDFDAFEGHVRNIRARLGLPLPEAWYTEPLFHFANRLALVGHRAAVCAPSGSSELDYGLALGVVIGRRGRDIPPERAWEHVAGLTIVNDLCARDLERRALPAGLGPAKGKDFASAVGPWLVPLAEFKDRIQGERLSLAMRARLNGAAIAEADAAQLYHGIPRLVAQASRDAELFPGDLLSTGAAAGGSLWESGGAWLSPGDRLELEVERIGVLETIIVARHTGHADCADAGLQTSVAGA